MNLKNLSYEQVSTMKYTFTPQLNKNKAKVGWAFSPTIAPKEVLNGKY